jgi:hypothetical protein
MPNEGIAGLSGPRAHNPKNRAVSLSFGEKYVEKSIFFDGCLLWKGSEGRERTKNCGVCKGTLVYTFPRLKKNNYLSAYPQSDVAYKIFIILHYQLGSASDQMESVVLAMQFSSKYLSI